MNTIDEEDFEARLGYRFTRPELLREALTHSSLANELLAEEGIKRPHNERLEFLGDSVLELVITEQLYERLSDTREGELTKIRASLVNAQQLAAIGKRIGLHLELEFGRSLLQNRHRYDRPNVVAGAFEAIVGAVYLDGGLDKVRQIVVRLFEETLEKVIASGKPLVNNYKNELQEFTQGTLKTLPEYEVLEEDEENDDERFTVSVSIEGKVMGIGKAHTKKAASQNAAREALSRLNAREGQEG